MQRLVIRFVFFFFNDTATTEIYTLSLHDALPIPPPGATPSGRLTGSPDGSARTRSGRPRSSTGIRPARATGPASRRPIGRVVRDGRRCTLSLDVLALVFWA